MSAFPSLLIHAYKFFIFHTELKELEVEIMKFILGIKLLKTFQRPVRDLGKNEGKQADILFPPVIERTQHC